jgi:putative ABC transport system permease protein
MGALWRDFHYGLRMLARNKGFTVIAVMALALGIGPNVAMFSIVWATLLAPLPYPHGDQLVVVWNKAKGERTPSSADDYLRYLGESRSFQSLDFSAWKELHFTSNGQQDGDVSGGTATPTFYTKQLFVGMSLGRDFLPEEGVPGNDHEVVLTHRLWRGRFRGDPNILGKQVEIEGRSYTVVGVEKAVPQDRGDGSFSVPLALNAGGHNDYFGNVFGRLKPGVTIAQAQAELAVIDQRLAVTRRGNLPKDAWKISVEPLKNDWMDKKFEKNLAAAGRCRLRPTHSLR